MGYHSPGTLKKILSILVVFLYIGYSEESVECMQKCFCKIPDVPRVKRLYHYGSSVPIVLEGSDRLSQNITNYVLKILLEEIIGYSQIKINYQSGALYNTSDVLRRLDPYQGEDGNDEARAKLPVSMINLEVPVQNGYDTSPWTSTDRIQNVGFLGPKGRLGWFATTHMVDELWRLGIISDHWRSLFSKSVAEKFALTSEYEQLKNLTIINDTTNKHYCDSPICEDGIFYGYGCPKTNFSKCSTLITSFPGFDNGALISQVKSLGLPVNVVYIGDNFNAFVQDRLKKSLPVLFFDINPSILTSTENVTRINFPLCQKNSFFYPNNCDFEGNQYKKFVWTKIRYSAPEVYHVISKMKFTDEIYTQQFIKRYKYYGSTEKAACSYLRYHQDEWQKWIPPNLSSKIKVSLLSFFPLSGSRWRQPGLIQGAKLALDIVNQNHHILPNHDLEMVVVDSQCQPGIALKEFIRYVGKRSAIPIAGVLGPACSDETEPIASLSRHFNMLTVSYGAEASSLSNRVNYPFFFRTIPEVSNHKFVYEKFFHAMNWNQLGAMSEGGQELPEYHLMLQEYLHQRGVSVIVKHNIQGTLQNSDVSEIFADLRSKNVKIIIADFYMPAARAVMCEAWRQRMTSREGYVWFLPSWYPNDWWDVDFYNSSPNPTESRTQENVPCSSDMMKYATDGYFVLSKTFSDSDNTLIVGNITVGQYKQMYAKRVGEAGVAGSAFASYVYDAVWVYAYALDKLFKNEPGALELIHSKSTAQKLADYVNQTDFHGVSGHIKFNGSNRLGVINILQHFHNGTRLVGQFMPGLYGGKLQIDETKIRWLTSQGKRPSDGHIDVEECVIETFRRAFGVTCEMAIVIANVIGFGVFLILVVLVLVFIKFRYDAKMRKTHERMKELGLLSPDMSPCLSLDEWEMARDKVVVNRKLGEGAFGTVFGGEAFLDGRGWVAVAVKALKIGARVDEKIDFLSEADIMKRFKHPNIVQLLGVCTRGEPVYAVMEYHLHGDLKTYLLSRRNLVGSDCKEALDISSERLTKMALDVASGLKYMHDLKYVHRDLACRNCLVHSNLTVKIGDFGMTRPIIESDYYRFTKKGMLPVRWMSPESLWDGLFTSKSDIWSYGVLLYEIVTFGSFPYQGLTNNQVIEYVKNQNRLILPGNCPEDIYRFIYNCLASESKDRLDLPDIIRFLKANPSFLEPCLDAPTNSVYLADDLDPIEFKSTSCHSTMTKSHSTNFLNFFNRLSQSSQDAKRLSGGSQSIKLLTPTKTLVKPAFSPSSPQGRQRSNSIGTPQALQKDKYNDHYEVPDISPTGSISNKSHRHSHEIPSSFSQCLPLLTSSEKGDRGDETSDYFSDNSKELCQNLTFEMCQTITSV